MDKFEVFHPSVCECGANFREPESIQFHISIAGHEFDFSSHIDMNGKLVDSGDGAISKGFHAGSYCVSCDEQIDEIDDPIEKWYLRSFEDGKIWGPFGSIRFATSQMQGDDENYHVFSSKIFREN